MKVTFSKTQTMNNCVSLEPENFVDEVQLRGVVNELKREGLPFEAFSTLSEFHMLNLPIRLKDKIV